VSYYPNADVASLASHWLSTRTKLIVEEDSIFVLLVDKGIIHESDIEVMGVVFEEDTAETICTERTTAGEVWSYQRVPVLERAR
jgi:hypothetical protein